MNDIYKYLIDIALDTRDFKWAKELLKKSNMITKNIMYLVPENFCE